MTDVVPLMLLRLIGCETRGRGPEGGHCLCNPYFEVSTRRGSGGFNQNEMIGLLDIEKTCDMRVEYCNSGTKILSNTLCIGYKRCNWVSNN